MIYVDTRRPFWRLTQTAPRFFGTAVVLASAAAFMLYSSTAYSIILAGVMLLKLAVELRCFRPLDDEDDAPTPHRQTAALLAGTLRTVCALRFGTGLLAIFLIAAALALGASTAVRVLLVGLALLSEGAERYLFFRAVFAPKMPGVPSI